MNTHFLEFPRPHITQEVPDDGLNDDGAYHADPTTVTRLGSYTHYTIARHEA
jgi:hypothetical protein